VERVVTRTLRKAAEERYANAGELARELERLEQALALGHLGAGAASRTGVTARLEAPAGPQTAVARPSRPTNLPARTSRLVGRGRELEEITATLRGGEVRLLTLTGPGGVGKTLLAAEAARLLLPDFDDGVFAVDLSALADPELLASHVAQALGLREAPGTTIAEELERYLADRQQLLLLDNFEHLLGAAPLVAHLLGAGPRLRVLATSRERLRLSREREYAVEPLEVPIFSSLAPLEELARAPAVALFVERAREVKPAFALTPDNARTVIEICRRVDGLPLALELAAARVKLLSPSAMLERLDHRLKLLGGGPRDLPTRQQTMRGAVQWSYDLLDAPEKALLRRLAVFAGGATLEAAEAVCGSGESEALVGLASLVDKSLLRQREQAEGEARFLMLEVVREFALEQLEAGGEAETARLAHARYFLGLAEEAWPKLRGAEQAAWLERLGREQENLRAALELLLEVEAGEGGRLAAALGDFWLFRSLYTEGRGWYTRAVAAGGADPLARAKLLLGLSNVEGLLGEHRAAGAHAREAVEASRAVGDPRLLAGALNALGTTFVYTGEAQRGREAFEEGLAIARDLDEGDMAATILNNLGDVAEVEGDYHAARGYFEQALEARGRHLRTVGTAICLLNLGEVSRKEGEWAAARAFLREALAILAELGAAFDIALGLEGLAEVALAAGERERAARLAGAAEALYEAVGAPLPTWEQADRDRFVARLRAELEAGALEREWGWGRAMGLEAAVREALEEADG
jgi:predicted ATPase